MLNTFCCLIGPNIAFKVHGVLDTSPVKGQVIIFGSTLENEGNAYNTSTGIFTAPVKGTYSFSTQICAMIGHGVVVDVTVDGTTYATVYVYDKDSYTCDTTAAVAVLNEQSQVMVKCTYGCGSYVLYDDSYRMNSFSGYLVHQ